MEAIFINRVVFPPRLLSSCTIQQFCSCLAFITIINKLKCIPRVNQEIALIFRAFALNQRKKCSVLIIESKLCIIHF